MSTATASAGAAILKSLINEIGQLQKPWHQMAEREQEVAIFRLRNTVEVSVRKLVESIACANFQRIAATVEQVTFKDGIKATLTLAKGADGAHELADSTGSFVTVVLANAQQFVDGIERVKAEADQADMFTDDDGKDLSVETNSWDEMISSLLTLEEGEQFPEMHAHCRALLAEVHVYPEDLVVESWVEKVCVAAAYWAIQYARNPDTAPARPHWLPLRTPPAEEAIADSSGDDESDNSDDSDDAVRASNENEASHAA
jgi:hypothetical protein